MAGRAAYRVAHRGRRSYCICRAYGWAVALSMLDYTSATLTCGARSRFTFTGGRRRDPRLNPACTAQCRNVGQMKLQQSVHRRIVVKCNTFHEA